MPCKSVTTYWKKEIYCYDCIRYSNYYCMEEFGKHPTEYFSKHLCLKKEMLFYFTPTKEITIVKQQ